MLRACRWLVQNTVVDWPPGDGTFLLSHNQVRRADLSPAVAAGALLSLSARKVHRHQEAPACVQLF
jgi:hypothetical protein